MPAKQLQDPFQVTSNPPGPWWRNRQGAPRSADVVPILDIDCQCVASQNDTPWAHRPLIFVFSAEAASRMTRFLSVSDFR
jgi:hypothetical protein